MPFRPVSGVVLALLLTVLAAEKAGAAAAARVADLATGPGEVQDSCPRQLTLAHDGRIVFRTEYDGHLWVTDGTAAGTRTLSASDPNDDPEILDGLGGGVILWVAESGIWRTDGTRAGTWLVTDGGTPLQVYRDIDIDRNHVPLERAFLGGAMYATACGGRRGCGVWRIDGTRAGTRPVGPYSFNAPAAASEAVFFTAGKALWRTDGTASAKRLREFPESLEVTPTAAGNKVFFPAPGTDGHGNEMWVSDGTRPGTRPLTRLAPEDPFPFHGSLVAAAGAHVLFAADDGLHGTEIWRSDGTEAGTSRITDLVVPLPFNDPYSSAFADQMLEIQGRVLVQARDRGNGWTLWVTDGDPASTAPLHGCLGGCGTGEPGRGLLAAVRGRALFLAEDAAHGLEPWVTDGTAAGTRLLLDACPGSCSSEIRTLSRRRDQVLFVAAPANGLPAQLWESDGTPAGTRSLTRFATGSGAGGTAPLTAGRRTFFSAVNADGEELWVLEGGRARQVANLAPDAPSSFPSLLTPFGDRLLFAASAGFPGEGAIWQTAGTEETTVRLAGLTSATECIACAGLTPAGSWIAFLDAEGPAGGPAQLWRTDATGAAVRLTGIQPPDLLASGPVPLRPGLVLFGVSRQDGGELWRSDGTPEGTFAIAALPGVPTPLSILQRGAGTEAWFGAGPEVWRSDGTAAGTVPVTVLPPSDSYVYVADPGFVQAGGRVFFASQDFSSTNDLWASDGTAAGTRSLTGGTASLWIYDLRELGSSVCFLALEPGSSNALWCSDGTPAGTRPLASIPNFDNNDDVPPPSLTSFAGRLFFSFWDPRHGTELWVTDGTAAGTRLVKDIHPFGSSHPSSLRTAGDRLFFAATDRVHGRELWQSDGTRDGTRLVQDITPGGVSSWPDGLTVAGPRLYFSADDGVTGIELWSLPLSGSLTDAAYIPRRRACEPSCDPLP